MLYMELDCVSGDVHCCLSVAQFCPTLCDPVDCSTPGSLSFTISWSFLKLRSCLTSIESMMLFNLLILCRPLLLWLQSFPESGSFSMSRLFASGGQRIGVSVSVLLMNIQGWLPLGLTGLISLQSKELSRVIGLWAVSLGITESFQTRGRGSPVSGDSQALSWAKGNRTWSRKYVSLMALACRADVKMNKQGGMIILFWIYVHISYRRS